jgi:HAD superfamily hydrolase (TIGR01509 family)
MQRFKDSQIWRHESFIDRRKALIKGVIFDMDGVMIDSERQSNLGWEFAAKQQGVEIPMWLVDSFKGAPNYLSKSFFDDYFKGKIDFWETRQMRTDFVYELRKKEGIPIKKGLFVLLDYIREHNIKCAVATSTKRESAENTLHNIGAWDYLDAVVYGDSVEHGKPEPDIFLLAAENISVSPDECIVIEDSINGIKAGFAAGMKVIHVPDTIVIGDEIRALTYKVCESLDEIPQIIDELCNR